MDRYLASLRAVVWAGLLTVPMLLSSVPPVAGQVKDSNSQSRIQQDLGHCAARRPPHLLFLYEAFADDLIDRRFHRPRCDRFAMRRKNSRRAVTAYVDIGRFMPAVKRRSKSNALSFPEQFHLHCC